MKAIQTRTNAAQPAKKTAPFFKKGAGQGFFKPAATGVQTKLTVGEPDDAYEKEADATADRVVKGLHSEPAGGGSGGSGFGGGRGGPGGGGGAGKGISRKPIFESENDPADAVQRKCAACEQEEKVQKKGAGGAATGGAMAASPAVESGISRSKGSGSSLPTATRSQMESSIGADFSGVRVHQDSGAQQMNKDLNAQAFTHGKDIYFDSGKYNPGSSEGKHLLAHELTHVVQQTGAGSPKKTAQRKAKSAGGAAQAGGTSGALSAGSAASVSGLAGGRSTGSMDAASKASGVDAGMTESPLEGMREEGPETMGVEAVQRTPVGQPAGIQRLAGTIQRDGASGQTKNQQDLANVTAPPEGKIETSKTLVLTNFPLKTYSGVKAPAMPSKRVRKPIPGERATAQGGKWKTKVYDNVMKRLQDVGDNPKPTDLFMLTIKDKGGKGSQAGKPGAGVKGDSGKAQIIGDIPTLADAVKVPYWNRSGKPTLHQIEHILDWQIVGNDADDIDNNLILVDKQTNQKQNIRVRDLIKQKIGAVQTAYKTAKIDMPIVNEAVTDTYYKKFRIFFENFQPPAADQSPEESGSIVQPADMEKNDDIVSKTTIELNHPCIPEGYCVVATAIGGEGFIVPYSGENEAIRFIGDKKAKMLNGMEQKNIIKAGATDVMKNSKDQPLKLAFEKDDKIPNVGGYYKLLNTGHATELKEILKLRGLSPIEFDPQVEVSPETGITAKGKVISEIPILKDADISVELSGGEFTVSGTLSSDMLKGKLPSPLDVESCDLTLSASTGKGWSVGGSIDFTIKNIGKGSLSASIDGEKFSLNGDFTFDETKYYKNAKLSIGYVRMKDTGEGKWSGSGGLDFAENAIPGIKSGNITLGYAEGAISGKGHFLTTIPKLKQVDVSASFDAKGNFSVTGDTSLEGVPGISENHITATLTRDESGYSLAILGTATPNLPNIPGLGATLTVSYNKGVFMLEGTATYEKDKLKGSLTVGVTNAVVDDNGVASKDATDEKIKIYGNGSITLHLLKGVDATLQGAVDGNGEMFIWGEMDVTATPFDPIDIDKTLFDVKTSIPLVGIPFASINLDLGTSGKFYFHWDPLTIKLKATLDRTNIKNIGEAGGELTANLSSHAKTGFVFTISAGVSVSIAIIKLGAHLNGNVDLGLNAEAGVDAKAHWDMQKGLTLEAAEAHLTGVPFVTFSLSGDITADVDLWLTSYNVYKKEMTFAQKTLDLSQFAFGVSVPLKITEDGKIEGIDYSKIKVQPEMGKDAGDNISDQVLNGDDRKIKEQKEKEAREKIRTKVQQKLQAKKADGDTDFAAYADDLKSDIKDDTPDELASMVDQIVDEEVQKMIKQQDAEQAAARAAMAAPGSGVPAFLGGPPDDDSPKPNPVNQATKT
ncbi:MAG TPA: DUF4157 domain-containing protein [Puia sp.]|nr:DUF4157 domain-containing protein [Puia sp.]